MKIVVVGTSNSVVGTGGYLKALRLYHEVINLSIGRVPFYCHIKTIENNKVLIESSDIMIIDHYVNDVNFYAQALGNEYRKLCDEFYSYLSTLNTRILNIFFPIRDLAKTKNDFYFLVKKLSRKYNISCLDLNEYSFKHEYYDDPLHLNIDSSYALGLSLSRELIVKNLGEKPAGGFIKSIPFKVINASDIYSESCLSNFSNSLLSTKYIDLNDYIIIKMPDSAKLLSIGYLKPKDKSGECGIDINGKKYGLLGVGYFHESVDSDFYGDIKITPILDTTDEITNLMGRQNSKGYFTYCFLTDFLFYDKNISFDIISPKRERFSIKLFDLIDIVKQINAKQEIHRLFNITIDSIRNLALSKESESVQLSYELMNIAHMGRPNGPLINRKLSQYKETIEAQRNVVNKIHAAMQRS